MTVTPGNGVLLRPTDDTQAKAILAARSAKCLVLLGRAGTGKTHLALGLALQTGRGIVLTRPSVECGETLGYIPGDLNEKFGPWLGPFRDVLGLMSFAPLEKLPVEIVPLQYMRGRTFRNCVVVLDEAQNATRAQLLTCLTRLGDGSQLIIAGDPTQTDIDDSPLVDVVNRIRGIAGVACVTLQKQNRDPFIDAIMKVM